VNIRNTFNVQSVTCLWDKGAHARNYISAIVLGLLKKQINSSA
jgi:hypothetical protein